MYDHPTAAELIAAARCSWSSRSSPASPSHGCASRRWWRQCAGIVERELAAGEAHLAATWRRAASLQGDPADQSACEMLRAAVAAQARRLCEDIRAGVYDDRPRRRVLLAHLLRTAEEELLVANPRFLIGSRGEGAREDDMAPASRSQFRAVPEISPALPVSRSTAGAYA